MRALTKAQVEVDMFRRNSQPFVERMEALPELAEAAAALRLALALAAKATGEPVEMREAS